jgi:colicin import membrane protein
VAKTPATRPRRSKTEVQQEFESIRRDAVAEREASDAAVTAMARSREADIRRAAEGMTVDAVVQELSALGLRLTKSLAELSGSLVAEVERLATVREAVAIEQRELQRLHTLDVSATAVDQLV